jgi:hypothetical protein
LPTPPSLNPSSACSRTDSAIASSTSPANAGSMASMSVRNRVFLNFFSKNSELATSQNQYFILKMHKSWTSVCSTGSTLSATRGCLSMWAREGRERKIHYGLAAFRIATSKSGLLASFRLSSSSISLTKQCLSFYYRYSKYISKIWGNKIS